MSQEKHPEDSRKNVSGEYVFQLTAEVIRARLDAEFLSDAKSVLNLFAGVLNETEFWLKELQRAGNNVATFTAVDKEFPQSAQAKLEELNADFTNRVTFKHADVFVFLAQKAGESEDMVTAYGAEYLWLLKPELATLLCILVAKVLKPGGIAAIPNIPDEAAARAGLRKLVSWHYTKD